MPRIRKPKYSHVFITDYTRKVVTGTKCNVLGRWGGDMVAVTTEGGETFFCYEFRVQLI